MSASIRPTLYPSCPSATARLTATVVLPTPPLPLPTATTCATPGNGCGPCCAPVPICPIRCSPSSFCYLLVPDITTILLGFLLVLRANPRPHCANRDEHPSEGDVH